MLRGFAQAADVVLRYAARFAATTPKGVVVGAISASYPRDFDCRVGQRGRRFIFATEKTRTNETLHESELRVAGRAVLAGGNVRPGACTGPGQATQHCRH